MGGAGQVFSPEMEPAQRDGVRGPWRVEEVPAAPAAAGTREPGPHGSWAPAAQQLQAAQNGQPEPDAAPTLPEAWRELAPGR